MRIAILTAMGSERALIEDLLEDRREVPFGVSLRPAGGAGAAAGPLAPRCGTTGRLGPHEAFLCETGIGKVNAALGAAEVLRAFRPDCLVSTGVAGGIDASLRVMDVVVATEVAYHDVDCGPGNVPGQVQGLPPRFASDARLVASAREAAARIGPGARVAFGLVCSGDRFISSRTDLDAVKRAFPEGLAVEMESGAIAQACLLFGVPFLGLRIVSDTPGAEGHVRQYEDFWGEMARRSFTVTRAFLEALPETAPLPSRQATPPERP